MFPNGRAGIAGSSETLLEDTVKRLILCALAVAGLCIPALATDPTPEQKAQIEKPMTMNNTGNEKKQVIFTHSAHAKTDCAFCHHKAVEGNIYVGCAAKGCHEGDVYPGVAEMLGRLKAAGLTLCTATCKPTDVVRPILEEQGLAPYFSFVGGASMDESRDNKTDVIRHVLAQPVMQGKRVLMVGDRRDDMQGAVNCGLDAAAVLYGYGGREEVAPFAPVFMAADCKELTDWALRPVDEPSHS